MLEDMTKQLQINQTLMADSQSTAVSYVKVYLFM